MILVTFLKMLCDISYIMCITSLIGSSYGVSPQLLPYVLLFSVCSTIAMVLDDKGGFPILRFIPIAIAGSCIIIAGNTASALALIPPVIYMLYICVRRLFRPEYYHTVNSFMPLFALLGITGVIFLLFGGWDILATYAGPYIIIYLLGMILLMRMLRHSEETMKQPPFLIMNGVSIAGVCLLSVILFTNTAMRAIKMGFLIIYKITVVPFMYIMSPIIAGIGWVIAKILTFIMFLFPYKPHDLNMGEQENAEQQIGEQLSKFTISKEWLYGIFMVILIIFIFNKLRNKGSRSKDEAILSSYAYTEPVKEPVSLSRSLSSIFPTTPAGQVRLYYRKLLQSFKDDGVTFTPQMDTRDIENLCCDLKPMQEEPIKKMRLLYLPARYGKSVSKQDAEEAKKLYRAIKKASR